MGQESLFLGFNFIIYLRCGLSEDIIAHILHYETVFRQVAIKDKLCGSCATMYKEKISPDVLTKPNPDSIIPPSFLSESQACSQVTITYTLTMLYWYNIRKNYWFLSV